jgi:hypothetical protein
MTEFTQEQLIKILKVCDPDEDYSEHRRGSTFYVGHYVEVTREDVSWVSEHANLDISSLVGKRIYAHGTYDDNWGSDYFEAYVLEKTEEVVPAWTEVIEHPESVKVTWNKI